MASTPLLRKGWALSSGPDLLPAMLENEVITNSTIIELTRRTALLTLQTFMSVPELPNDALAIGHVEQVVPDMDSGERVVAKGPIYLTKKGLYMALEPIPKASVGGGDKKYGEGWDRVFGQN